MLIGILQCGHFPTAEGYPERNYTDLYSALLDGHGFSFRTWSVVDMEFPANVQAADGWLISGSRHGAYDDEPFIAPLEGFIRDAYSARVPLVGICFGHQIMAQSLGGTVEKFAGGWSVGRVEYDFDGEAVPLNAWHQDQVVAKPPEARVVAETDFCQYAGFRYDGPAYSVQPHPEFDEEAVRLLLDKRAPGVVPDDQIKAARGALGATVANGEMGRRIGAFFKEARDG